MRWNWKQFVAVVIIIGVSWMLVQLPVISHYIYTLKSNSIPVIANENSLLEEIKKKAELYSIPPQDAKIDPIWKTVPGYNGLEVDIEESFNNMEEDGVFDEKKLVFHQISPKKHLEDLPPAPIYRAHPEKPVASFLINVAWGNEYLKDMLSTLKKHDVKATFFLEGKWTKNNPEFAKMIAEAGHEIGNHSYSHPNMKLLGSEATMQELKETNEIIRAVTGVTCIWFAPPSGSYNELTVKKAAELNMRTIMWSVDTIDWQKPAPHVLVDRVMSKVHNGAFILMHPTESTSVSLETLILNIKKKGIRLTTISEALKEKRMFR
jgi:probable sporulation protein (polysaccharide deacetylase family)